MTTTPERDELALALFISQNHLINKDELVRVWHAGGGTSDARRMATAILAAGYRRPRTITEHYGDEGIESLSCGSVILAGITTSTLQSDGTWLDSWGSTYDFYELNLPATVLHNGGAV